jgi:hypothetical protein
MPAGSTPVTARSSISNGTTLLLGVDGRSSWARRARDLIADHLSDLGGEDHASAAERSIIRRACVLTVELERIELRFAKDEGSNEDVDLYQRTSNSLRRLLEAIGLQRRPRTVVPSLSEYLEADADDEMETS